MKPKLMTLIGVFLISLTGLMFEVLLTRVFSSLLWYHFAFIAISSALLGWGLGAWILTFFRRRYSLLGILSFIFSLAILLFLYIVIVVPATTISLTVYYIFAVFPFLLGGMCLSLVFDIFGKYSGRLYFYDLLGASLGALSVPLLLRVVTPSSLIILTAIIPLLASLFFMSLSKRKQIFPYILIFILVGVFIFNVMTNTMSLPIGQTKALAQQLNANKNLHIVRTEWNSFSRVDLVEGFGDNFLANNYIDTFAWTYIIPWNQYSMNYTKGWFRYLPYAVKPKPKVLIIGPGGGTDVALALASGSNNVTAVEINSLIVKNVRSYGSRAGNIYNNPKVNIFVDEGRNFVSRSSSKYDMVLLGFVDSSSAIIAGGLVMAENYLYTVEAFEDYLSHLNRDGVLAFVRYEIDIPRLITIAKEALKGVGIQDNLKNHLIVVSQTDPSQREKFLGNQMVFIIKKSPFTMKEISRIKPIIEEENLSPVILPYTNIDEPYNQFLSNKMSFKQFESRFNINIKPTHDDNPFYFAYYKPLGIPMRYLMYLSYPFLVSLLLFGLVLLFKRTVRKEKIRLRIHYLIYFTGLGMGFMLMEIPILQKFILLLGRPVYTFSVILFSLLLSVSFGSLASGRFHEKKLPRTVIYSIIIASSIMVIYLFLLTPIIRVLLPLSLPLRIIMTFILLLPLGFFIGIPFPSGMRMLKIEKQDVPLAWGVNGLASVFGSVLATVIGVAINFSTALLLSVLSYIMVIVCTIIISARLKKISKT